MELLALTQGGRGHSGGRGGGRPEAPAPSSTQTPVSWAKLRRPCPESSCLREAGSLGDGGLTLSLSPFWGVKLWLLL